MDPNHPNSASSQFPRRTLEAVNCLRLCLVSESDVMINKANVIVCGVWAATAMMAFSSAALLALDCNSKVWHAAGGDCGTATPCPAFTTPGSCGTQTLTIVQQPRKDYCAAGTASTYCEETGPEYDCTKAYYCKFDTFVNPVWTPTSPANVPHFIDTCVKGQFQMVSSTAKVALGGTCSQPAG